MFDRFNDTSKILESSAFIFYRSQTKKTKEEIFYNLKAWDILSQSPYSRKDKPFSHNHISSLCSKWKDIFFKRQKESENNVKNLNESFLDTFPSGRRGYAVHAITLSHDTAVSYTTAGYFIFIIERITHDNINISMIVRQWNLNNRERDIILLLLKDRSNKEIAASLNLSINTIKGYTKVLMRKLAVSSRAGIVSRLLTTQYPTGLTSEARDS